MLKPNYLIIYYIEKWNFKTEKCCFKIPFLLKTRLEYSRKRVL